MIPLFPNSKKIEPKDRDEIVQITKIYPPYSDYNFTSLWCWDVNNKTEISNLNGNLVLKFNDYISDKIIYSILGSASVEQSVNVIFTLLKEKGLKQELKLVPEETIEEINPENFTVNEDRDNFDYIYSIDELCSASGQKWGTYRNQINRFCQSYDMAVVRIINLSKKEDQNLLIELLNYWLQNKEGELHKEKNVIERYIAYHNILNTPTEFINLGIFVNDQLIAFSVNEIINQTYGITHFAKANVDYKGVYAYLMKQTAQYLRDNKCTLLNYEQDLGIQKLRYSKMSYNPIKFQKKYTIW